MASKDDLFAQFKVQTTALLSAAESKRVKDALSAFLESKVTHLFPCPGAATTSPVSPPVRAPVSEAMLPLC